LRIFLSFHSKDQALAETLRLGLKQLEPDTDIFLSSVSLGAGFWQRKIAQEIAAADAFVLLIGPAGVGPWQELEYDEALDRHLHQQTRFPLVPLIAAGAKAPGLSFLRRLNWIEAPIVTEHEALHRLIAALKGETVGTATPLWKLVNPYRGLEAMTEANTDYFYGRTRETAAVLTGLAEKRGRCPILIGASGVGKSSVARAGVLSALKSMQWPGTDRDATNAWPPGLKDSRSWLSLVVRPGEAPLEALAAAFTQLWQLDEKDPDQAALPRKWAERLSSGSNRLTDLINATQSEMQKRAGEAPERILIYIDQSEELYTRAVPREAQRFSELMAEGLSDRRLSAFASLRADYFDKFQADEPLFKCREHVDVPPLDRTQLHQVVTAPARLLGVKFEDDKIADRITDAVAAEQLPLLSYLLLDMWNGMVARGDATLRLSAQAINVGGVLSSSAEGFLAQNPDEEDALRRLLMLKLVMVPPEGEPVRRQTTREECSEAEWSLAARLAEYPWRLVVMRERASDGRIVAEVAHEAFLRSWPRLRDWLHDERDFLAWRNGLETSRRAWQAMPDGSKHDALLMGAALARAQSWFTMRSGDLHGPDREFIRNSIERQRKAQRRARRGRALIYVLLIGTIAGLVAWINQAAIDAQLRWYFVTLPYMQAQIRPHVMSAMAEEALGPGDMFKECVADCPEMIVVPPGSFMMGSPSTEHGHTASESPLHSVRITKPIAVSKFDVTFADWDACADYGDCPHIFDSRIGRGQQPVINVTWDEAQQYVAWLSKMTGKTYRLLSEAEYEYATRAGAQTVYPWGDELGKNNAACDGCGSQWDKRRPAPVGSFAPNRFGLYDIVGNVWQWLEDCDHSGYQGAPTDGSAWIKDGDCEARRVRGGSYAQSPDYLRSAFRGLRNKFFRNSQLGFRIGRTLISH
jgi:formylglycine-generating enzyme required for sulfatase activity